MKLSLHVLPNSADAEKFVRTNKPEFIKLVSDYQLAKVAREVGTKTIGRVYVPNEYDSNASKGYWRQDANNYFLRYLYPEIKANPLVDMWSGPNEVHPKTEKSMEGFGIFCAELLRLFFLEGKGGVVGGFSVGTPGQASHGNSDLEKIHNDWKLFAPALEAANQYSGGIEVHEYIERGFIEAYRRGEINSDWRGWLAGRYRHIKDVCRELGMMIPNVFITELGIGEGDLAPFRISLNGNGTRYVNEYLWPYNLMMEDDTYVRAGFIFTAGGAGWNDYSIDGAGVVGRLAQLKNHNFRPRTNQMVINLFASAFGKVMYWPMIMKAGLTWMAFHRQAIYTGPDVENLPLSQSEKDKLISKL